MQKDNFKALSRMTKTQLEALARELRLSEKSMYHERGGLLRKDVLIDNIKRRMNQNAAGGVIMVALYNVFSVPADTKEPQKGGRKLNATPMTLKEVKTFVSKFTEHKHRIIVWRRWVPEKPGSWIIVRKDTGEAVMETFEEETAKAINKKKYKAVPVLEYLQALNAKIKAGE